MGINFDEKPVPQLDAETCSACGLCARICPSETLAMEDGRLIVAHRTFMGCVACGHCMMVCPTGSITVRGRRFGPEDLVDLPSYEPAGADQFDAMVLRRRAVRRFRDQPVDRRDVDRILEMTSTAPMGIPPTEVGVLVFHGREKARGFEEESLDCFRRTVRMFQPVVLALMRPFLGKTLHQLMRDFVRPLYVSIIEKRDEGQNLYTYDAPVVLLFHGGPTGDATDTAIAATYAMLAAESLGLGTCLLGTPAALDHDKAFKARHGIPRENKIGLGLAIGHADVKFHRGVRRKLASVRFA